MLCFVRSTVSIQLRARRCSMIERLPAYITLFVYFRSVPQSSENLTNTKTMRQFCRCMNCCLFISHVLIMTRTQNLQFLSSVQTDRYRRRQTQMDTSTHSPPRKKLTSSRSRLVAPRWAFSTETLCCFFGHRQDVGGWGGWIVLDLWEQSGRFYLSKSPIFHSDCFSTRSMFDTQLNQILKLNLM